MINTRILSPTEASLTAILKNKTKKTILMDLTRNNLIKKLKIITISKKSKNTKNLDWKIKICRNIIGGIIIIKPVIDFPVIRSQINILISNLKIFSLRNPWMVQRTLRPKIVLLVNKWLWIPWSLLFWRSSSWWFPGY